MAETLTATERIKTFFQVHHAFISLTGVIIVFLGFIVKDGFRDHLKELKDAVGSANAQYEIRRDVEEMSKEAVTEIKESTHTAQTPQIRVAIETENEAIAATDKRSDGIDHSLRVVSAYLEGVPSLDQFKERYDQLNARSKSLATQVGKAFGEVKWGQDSPPVHGDVQKMQSEGEALEKEVDAFQDEVTAAVKQKKEHTEFLFQVVTYLTYALYSVGFGLSFIATWAGIKAGASTE
jgi:hypothetical protein